ncbi:Dip2p [Sugiyamaella lignohabitans]|uniref:Dip2p n=1 Tax=Sugiyamaella lignohabitans TaxID=796027 RepID=A0A167FG10_9ASCO|nr:Dip2p [Sugiyamaella lignohabitans]ANB15252.1 Dip2p [Sugiyamaella lignohabitans]
MVKTYSRYEALSSFGVISSNSNVAWLPSNSSSTGLAVVGGLEDVLLWDIKSSTLIARLAESRELLQAIEVSQVSIDPTNQLIAAGYTDGSIRVWDVQSKTVLVTFNGHKSAISSLKFDKSGTRLASGSRDSNIVVWDLVAEVGLYRLRSHRDQITSVAFLGGGESVDEPYLLSTSKDGMIKLWSLDIQHCVETHVAHRGECWSMGLLEEQSATIPDEDGNGDNSETEVTAVTSGATKDIKFWSINLAAEDGEKVVEIGTLPKQSPERGLGLKYHSNGRFFAISNSDKSVEIWRKRSLQEIKKSVARKQKRRKDKGLEADPAISEDNILEKYIPFTIIRTSAKVRNFDWIDHSQNRGSGAISIKSSLDLVVNLSNNSIEYYSVVSDESSTKKAGPADYTRSYAIDLAGHRSDIRALSISSDKKMVVSAANGSLKLWNIKTNNCLRTFLDCGYILCCSFLPGDALVVTGTKEGTLALYDIASSSIQEELTDAHTGAIWSLDISADGKTLVTASADKTVKFWEFRIVQEEVPGTNRTFNKLKLKHTKTLELTDDILAVKLSPDFKLIACSLLDNTVKVFFTDTLKFFLNLYGHKLPVLSLDISHDSKLLVTCSADKNIKIWGLDFGDCHKSLFGHQDSIMKVLFEPGTHNFFSASKDKTVKYWDGDKFENIQKLVGHKSEVWSLAIANDASFVVSGSHDKSVRIWELTDEPLFLEEEREKELEELYEATLTSSLEDDEKPRGEGEDEEDLNEVERAGKQTIETLKAGEKLMEALDIGIEDLKQLQEHELNLKQNPKAAPPVRNIILKTLDVSAERYVMDVLQRIKPSQLEDALLVFSFDKVISLFKFIEIWALKQWNIPLLCRVLMFTLRTYHKQIVANNVMRTNLETLRNNLLTALDRSRQQMGYNIAGLKYIKQNWDIYHTKEFVDEKEYQENQDRQLKKRAFTTVN